MSKFRAFSLIVALSGFVSLTSCQSQPTSTTASPAATSTSTASTTEHSGHGKKININNAILSELDKLEAKLGIPALSNKIQASRPYATPEELVSKNVISQAQYEQIKDQVTVEDIVLTGEAKDVDYMTKLGLMKGHLIVAQELLNQQKPDQAEPHIGHPVEEIYVDVEEQLSERKVPDFKNTLISLQDLVKANPKSDQLKTQFDQSMQGVDTAIAALPETQRQDPRFVLQTINGLLDAANSEYGAAIANGKVSAPIEYQDSRGFVVYANQLYQGVAKQVEKANPDAAKAIATSLTELQTVWPAAIPPANAVKTPDEVTKLVKTIEQNAQTVIKQ